MNNRVWAARKEDLHVGLIGHIDVAGEKRLPGYLGERVDARNRFTDQVVLRLLRVKVLRGALATFIFAALRRREVVLSGLYWAYDGIEEIHKGKSEQQKGQRHHNPDQVAA